MLKRITWKASLLAIFRALLGVTTVFALSGSLDSTFNGTGEVTANVDIAHSGADQRGFAMAIQPADGKIVVAGWDEYASTSDFAVARFNVNGSLDTTFSGDGKLTTDFGGGFDRAFGVAIQSDKKIVVIGDSCTDNTFTVCNVAVARYNPDGSLDTTFNGSGKKRLTWSGLSTNVTGGLAIQSNGKILVEAIANGSANDLGVFRLNPNGSLDTTFNGTGMKAISFGTGVGCAGGWGRTLAIQPLDGKIVMAGATNDTKYFCVARLNSNGSLDLTFNGTGKQTTFFGAGTGVWALALQPDGRIVVVGAHGNSTLSYFAMARYNTNGTLDTTFNGTGKKLIGFSAAPNDIASSVAVQTNGKIVVCGQAAEIRGGDFALARLNPNGSLDATLTGTGAAGIAAYDFSSDRDLCRAIAIDSSGRYVLAGAATVSGQPQFAVLRALP